MLTISELIKCILFSLKRKIVFSLATLLMLGISTQAQHEHQHGQQEQGVKLVEKVEAQPLLSQALRVGEALSFIGNSSAKGKNPSGFFKKIIFYKPTRTFGNN